MYSITAAGRLGRELDAEAVPYPDYKARRLHAGFEPSLRLMDIWESLESRDLDRAPESVYANLL